MIRRKKYTTRNNCSSFITHTTPMLVPETQMRLENTPELAFANRDKISDEEFVHSSNNQWPNLDKLEDCHLIADVSRHYPPTTFGDGQSAPGSATCVDSEHSNIDIWSKATGNLTFSSSQLTMGAHENCQDNFKKESDVPNVGQASPNFCQGCKKIIQDRYLLNIAGLCWHENCAKCTSCFSKLTTSCFFNDGQLYCRDDYERTRTRCAGCSSQIEKDEMVMKVTNSLYVYHVACFACAICKRLLRKGDEFIFNNIGENSKVIELQCKSCWGQCKDRAGSLVEKLSVNDEKPLIINNLSPGRSSDVTDSILSPKSLMCALSPSKSDEDEGMSSDDDSTCGQLNSSKEEPGEGDIRSRDADDNESKDSKRSKRPRTILNAVQRRAFKAAFEVTPKPCRKVRETLAKDTGLTVRVVQVWFQNQRAKMKKLAKRQQSQEAAAQKAREEFAFHAFDPMNPMMHHHLPHLIRDGKPMMENYGYMNINQSGTIPFTQVHCEQQQMGFPASNYYDNMTYFEGGNTTSPPGGDCVTNPHVPGCNPSINQIPQSTHNQVLFPNNLFLPNAAGREMTNENDTLSISPIHHTSGVVTPIDSLYTMQNNYFNS